MARKPDLPDLDRRALPGPDDITREQLPNGIVLLIRENHASPSVVLQGYLSAGAAEEGETDAGLAQFAAAGLMRGTRRRSFEAIYNSIESIGAGLRFGSGKHRTSFHAKGLAEDLPLLLDLLGEVVREPAFPAEPMERLRAERLSAIDIRDQDTGAVAGMNFDRLAYPGHPYAVASDGSKASMSGLTLKQVAAFHARTYGPQGMVIAVVGAVHADRARAEVERSLGSWTVHGQERHDAIAPAPKLEGLKRVEVVLDGKSQCDLVVGAPGPSRADPDYLACALGNNIFGRFGLYGRVGDAVRERAGLAYYAYSSLAGGPGPGPWTVSAGVNPANIEQAVTLIRGEIERFVSRRVSIEELRDNQAHFIGRLPLQLEANDGVASALVNLEQYDLGLDYYRTFPDQVAAVRRDHILEAARRFLSPDHLAIAVAGPSLDGDPA